MLVLNFDLMTCHSRCYACDTEISTSNGEVGKPQITEILSPTDVLGGVHSNATVAVGVALCVVVVVIATVFIWHSSRHSDCSSRFTAFKMAALSVAPSVSRTGNNNSSKPLNAATPSSGAILVPSVGRVHGRQQRAPPVSERRVVIGRSASRDGTGARDDVISASALHVSLNRLPLGDLLGPTNYIPYRLKQSYC